MEFHWEQGHGVCCMWCSYGSVYFILVCDVLMILNELFQISATMPDPYDCTECKVSLYGQRYILREENMYCIKCYEDHFSHNCEVCHQLIGCTSKVNFHLGIGQLTTLNPIMKPNEDNMSSPGVKARRLDGPLVAGWNIGHTLIQILLCACDWVHRSVCGNSAGY